MVVIDADGHAMETFEDRYYEEPARSWPGRPRILKMSPGDHVYGDTRLFYEGRYWPKWPEWPGNPLGPARAGDTTGGGGGSNPHLRIKDMDAMGIDVSVLYPSVSIMLGDYELSPYAAQYCRAYNNWLADYCKPYPERLKGVTMVPLHDVPEAVKEVRRAAENLGFVGVTVPYHVKGKSVNERRALSHPDFDPFWEECRRLDVAVGPHQIPVERPYPVGGDLTRTYFTWRSTLFGFSLTTMCMDLVCGGVLEKFPKLRFGFLEGGIGWSLYLLERLDANYEKPSVGGHREHPLLKKKPSEYMRSEQCYYSCEVEDLTLPAAVHILGENRILWASDYPHHDAEKDAVQILKAREDIPESAKWKILSENAARFYNIKY